MADMDLIYVTGFGLFGGHEQVNASWEAVRLLPTVHILADGSRYRLKLREVPVTYSDVDQAVDDIWKEDPKVIYSLYTHSKYEVDVFIKLYSSSSTAA